MHIVYLTSEYPKTGLNGGGIGSVVAFLGRQLVKRGHSISVVGINNMPEDSFENDNGVQVYRLARSTWKIGKFYDHTKRTLRKINKIAESEKVDIVEGSELNFAFFPKRTSYKKIIRLHGGHHFFAIELDKKPSLWKGFQEKKSFKKADGYIAVSDYVGSQTQKHLNLIFPYQTIHNSVDTEIFSPSDTSLVERNTLLFVGTVCEKKGVRQLVQAFPLIRKQIPSVKLKIVGRDWKKPDGSSYISYLKLFISPADEDAIIIVGPVPHAHISKLMEQTDVCVFPSHMESMPIAWLEALAMGKKVVASNIGPGKEAIIQNQTGILVNPFKPNEIANGAIKILKDENADAIGIAARKDVSIRFNVEKIIGENISYYMDIIY